MFGQQVAVLTTDGFLKKCVFSSSALNCQQYTLPKDKISVVKYAENNNIYLGGGNLYVMRQNSQNIELLQAIVRPLAFCALLVCLTFSNIIKMEIYYFRQTFLR